MVHISGSAAFFGGNFYFQKVSRAIVDRRPGGTLIAIDSLIGVANLHHRAITYK